jgi:hypothetical protein
MSLCAAVVRELINAGLSGEALAAACERIEAGQVTKRTARQERNARYYAANKDRLKPSEKRLKTSYQDDPLSPLSPSPQTPLPLSPLNPPYSSSSLCSEDEPPSRRTASGEPDLVSAGVSTKLISDWRAVRRNKRAGPITATVAAGLIREARIAGLSASDAVRTSIERGWQGFKAEWLRETRQTGPPRKDFGQLAIEAAERDARRSGWES